MRHYFLVLLAVIAAAYAVQFDIAPGGIRCFTDQFDKGEIISGNVNVQGLTQMQLQFWVDNPMKTRLHNTDDVSEGTFAFAADIEGQYDFCFIDSPRPGFPLNSNLQRRVSLSYTVQRDNKKNEGTKETLKPLEQKLKKIEDMTNDIREELRHHREREAEHRNSSETQNARVAYLTVFTVISLGVLSVAQIYYLRRFFQRKKLL
eukprot:TRINITY_DN13538_c0_g1_i1.p1 TRINITY_DN13538_c0_g1~~TRINITY_DN13538_c0_g1_i1.p1  ORF type:complete len:204 (-),score=60.05 TRINITY_DN13538_c0_g1_i1:101-712(-)